MTSSENHAAASGESDLIATISDAPEPSEAVDRMTRLSKAGKLAGFEAGSGGVLASFAAFGNPFDGRVEVTASEGGLRFDLRMPRKMPAIFAVVLVLTVWPGLPLTDAFLQGFGWYERLTSGWLETWMWYLPLAAIPAPFALLAAIKKSRVTARAHAAETVERLRVKLAG